MKKILILTAIFLLPILAFSNEFNYELDLPNPDFAKQLDNDIKNDIKYQQQLTDPFPPEYYVDKIKFAIDNSIKLFEDKFIFKRYYDVELLKMSLSTSQNYGDILKNDTQVLHEAARYILNNYPHRNDFEALLAIGIDPVEAAVRMNNEEYIQSALEKGSITYSHHYVIFAVDEKEQTTLNGRIDRIAIQAKTDAEQIEAIKSKVQQQEECRKQSKPIRKLWNNLPGTNYIHW